MDFEGPEPDIDLLIIGAGLSGLTTAYQVLKKEPSLKVLVLDAAKETGGQVAASNLIEPDMQWITDDQRHIINLCSELNVKFETRDEVDPKLRRAWEIDRGSSAYLATIEFERFINYLEFISPLYRPGRYELSSKITMERYITKKLLFESSRNIMRLIIRACIGVDSHEISFGDYLIYCNSTNGIKNQIKCLTGTGLGIQSFQDGTKDLIKALESHIGRQFIVLNTKVTNIYNYRRSVLVKTNRDFKFHCQVLVLAIPWNEIEQIKFFPDIPNELRLPYQGNKNFVSCFTAQFNEDYWRCNGYNGSFMCHNPHTIIFETGPNKLSGRVWHDEDFEQILEPYIMKILQETICNPIGVPLLWNQDTWEQTILTGKPPTTPWNNIVWASTNSSTSYRGFMNGAVQSGLRAALSSLLTLRPQSVTWMDFDEVQVANVVTPKVDGLKMAISSVSLYDMIFYGSIIFITVSGYIIYKRSASNET